MEKRRENRDMDETGLVNRSGMADLDESGLASPSG
jgi:hypothetical protein